MEASGGDSEWTLGGTGERSVKSRELRNKNWRRRRVVYTRGSVGTAQARGVGGDAPTLLTRRNRVRIYAITI